METAPNIKTTRHGKFVIEATAELRGELWFPDFQILTDGQVACSWQSPGGPGLPTEQLALDTAVETAIHDIENGLAAIFS